MRRTPILLLLAAPGCPADEHLPGRADGDSEGDDDDVAVVDSGPSGHDGGDRTSFDAGERDRGVDAAAEDRWPDRDLTQLALNGTIPADRLTAPEFAATAHTGEVRTRDDLVGQPTAMWFYPAAFTGG